jgi:hypothetical protein
VLVGTLVAFDADTLARLGSVHGVCDASCERGGTRFAFVGPRSPLLFFTSHASVDHDAFGGCASAALESRDPRSGQLLAVADLVPLASVTGFDTGWCAIDMAMATVPSAPRALTSEVHARRVTLAWTDPGNTTHFQVEGGSGSGLANLYQQAVGGTSLTVDEVPPGTYYVRVRAVNFVGRSVPAEIRIVVP